MPGTGCSADSPYNACCLRLLTVTSCSSAWADAEQCQGCTQGEWDTGPRAHESTTACSKGCHLQAAKLNPGFPSGQESWRVPGVGSCRGWLCSNDGAVLCRTASLSSVTLPYLTCRSPARHQRGEAFAFALHSDSSEILGACQEGFESKAMLRLP